MNKNLTIRTLTPVIFFVLFLSQLCLANPIMMSPKDPIPQIVRGTLICLMVDFVVLTFAFGILSKFHYALSLKFTVYYLCVVVAGFLVNGVVAILDLYEPPIAVFLILSFAGLYGCNFCLSRSFFDFSPQKATVVALLMGVITNPYAFGLVVG